MKQAEAVLAKGYYDHDQSEILSLVSVPVKSVLEVGCASGNLLRHYLDAGAERVTGVEYVDAVAQRARERCPGASVFQGNVDEIPLDLLGREYDLLIASFVLEHVTDPWKTLTRLAGLLRRGGQFVGALPNVRYWGVTLPLLFKGRWDYVDEGVLDRTHYRFFTKSTIGELLKDCGFGEVRFQPVLGRKSSLANALTLGFGTEHLSYAYRFAAIRA